ncbi:MULTISPECIES: single-stranded DNA-binding protein [unclassified Streptomyces]|uniref:single-stranded DNA-binding protein n=1 Tax=unclassified Streptomyces TaxID=2593676 RepID=UPI0022595103|nr:MULTISPECIES: single-stranded DNA-binding protein [unclassified Streptomyces]MCX5140331.1 single-stranded DNA-binding protein [Streptomyces sp. NBC_00338]WRZ64888.1 single-stranded DNA-binding protein [Streptomyces sp. NBC_01257]WSU58871.1 single-stranded DNA-binding protein [Streptomyces sp. NBC_01104]
MNETLVTLVGNAATGVEFRDTASGGMARFRFAVTPRRWDREKELWTDGHTSFYTVWAWRTLASNLSGSVSVGEPLVVHGRLKVREEEREGQRRTFVDIEAMAVGHDLTRGTAAFRRVVRGDPGLTARTGRTVTGEPDQWAVRDGQGRPKPPAETAAAETTAQAPPRAPEDEPTTAGRPERPPTRRRTTRQKPAPELVSAP